jgi:DNA-binding transcriptional MerR regulator
VTAEQRYRIKTVSEMTGIPRNTLLAWERRYGILAPERLSNGYRLYSDDDVRLLRQIKAEVERGVAISQALESLRRGATREASNVDPTAVQGELFEHLARFDRAATDRVVAGLAAVPYATLIDDVYIPLLRRVGDEWEAGRVTVAQEHFAAAFVREQLVSMLLRLGAQPHRGPHVACVTFPGELHELAILALTVHLVLRGCRVTYLGVDVPEAALIDFLDRVRPDCLCVSVIIRVEPERLAVFARAVRRSAPASTRIVIGGAGLPPRPKAVKGVELVDDWRGLELG